ncbi:MAG: hypothetical protein OEM59_02185 [Rhodospirillales bacterium]|nr:hypothetical protein [Rhodospirillales bacterium]
MTANAGNMDFQSFWGHLQTNLIEGSQVHNWTAHGGYLGDSFKVVAKRPTYVEVSSPAAAMIQHISRGEFQKLREHWDAYIAREMPRYRLRDLTRFSKYIISIMHHLEKRN